MRLLALLSLICLTTVTGCIGPIALHEAVLGYDQTISRLEQEMLLLNIARTHHNLPVHFTVTSHIAATFDYRANTGIVGTILESPGLSFLGLNIGASVAENPTLSIVPIQGEEFTTRILTPMDESKFKFLVFQGAPIDMVARLMADGIEVQNRDGTFQRFILNRPTAREEYKEFRRRVLHLGWLNAHRKLFVGTLSFEEKIRAQLTSPLTPSDFIQALEKGYRWRRTGKGPTYELSIGRTGRVAITNYDPRTLSHAERRALNALATANPKNFVLVDIRPNHPGGNYPLFGAIKLRSLNVILDFLATGISKRPEFDVMKDSQTGKVVENPRRALGIKVSKTAPPKEFPQVLFRGRYYSIGNASWDQQAFKLLFQLFQMTVTDVSRVGVPSITISK